MSKRSVSVLILTTNVACIAFASYVLISTRVGHAAGLKPQNQLIAQPSEWIPFSADVTVTHTDQPEPIYGRFYRDRHGCARLETGTQREPRAISIHNIPLAEYYTWGHGGAEWTAGPMRLPPGGWRPAQRRVQTPGLEKHPLHVEVRRGKIYNLRADEGFSAYRYVNNSGTLSLQVPELNFFNVMKQSLEGRREVYSNVEIGEQPEPLFQPPGNAAVKSTDKLGGIVTSSKDDIPLHLEHQIRGGRE